MTANQEKHICKQEGSIAELRANMSNIKVEISKTDNKIDDILKALNRSNEANRVNDTELKTSFKAIERMLASEAEHKNKLSATQNKIEDSITNISNKVIKIENDISYIKEDLGITKTAAKSNNDTLITRVTSLEKVSYFVYAVGAVLMGLLTLLAYSNQLLGVFKTSDNTKVEKVEPYSKTRGPK